MTRGLGRFALSLFLLPGLAVAGDPWVATFGAAAAGSYLDEGRPTVILVGAGTEVDSTAAVAALRTALRESRRARVVMDGAAVGDVRALDDQSIVKKTAPLPVDVIAILRLFPGEGTETAVVTLYDKKGATLGALSAVRGTPLVPHPRAAGQGVSREAADAVGRVIDQARGPQPEPAKPLTPAQREYHQKALSLEYSTVERMWGSGDSSWEGPSQGLPAHVLTLAEFYEAVGRKDYASFVRARARTKLTLLITGLTFGAAGVAMAAAGGIKAFALSDCLKQSTYGLCTEHRSKSGDYALIGAGSGVALAGIIVGIVALALDRAPISAQETYSLGLEHNRKLRQRLGLPEPSVQSVTAQGPAAARPRLIVAPTAAPGGGGLALGGAF